MKMLIAMAVVLVGLAQQDSPTTVPKIDHYKESHVETTDIFTRKCPEGYEGHFVDPKAGFDFESGYFDGANGPFFTGVTTVGESAYTICFKKDFMDKVRKNPDLLTIKPQMHGA